MTGRVIFRTHGHAAMAVNVTKKFWEIADIIDVLQAWEAANRGG